MRERISQLGLMLRDKPELDFETMFLDRTWNSQEELRQMLVVTLMSILEMVKMGIMGIHQAQGSSTVALTARGASRRTHQDGRNLSRGELRGLTRRRPRPEP